MALRNEDQRLEFFFSEKQGFLVINLSGAIAKSTADAFEACQKECESRAVKYVVVSLHDVTYLEIGGIPAFVRFQKYLRDRPAELRLCFVSAEHYQSLEGAGAIRPAEISENLVTALQSLAKRPAGSGST